MIIQSCRNLAVALLTGATCCVSSLKAQESRITPKEIAQIADEVLRTLMPPGQFVSRVEVSKRGVFFDHVRTLAAFGQQASTVEAVRTLRLQSPVLPGSRAMLNDCTQTKLKSCAGLGWAVYVWLEPIFISRSDAEVRANVFWPDRGAASFQEGVSPSGRAYLVGYSMNMILTRAADGSWKLSKQGKTLVY